MSTTVLYGGLESLFLSVFRRIVFIFILILSILLSKLASAVLTCICEVTNLNFCCDSNYTDFYLWVLHPVAHLSNWFLMIPSIATKFQYVNSLLFSLSLTICFDPYGPSSGEIYN
jgi:hypothetical protein